MRAKTWAFDNGHIKADGRGRMPKVSLKDGRDLTVVLMEAKKSGVSFTDWPKGQVTVTESKDSGGMAKTEVKVTRSAADSGAKVISEITILFPEDEFKAVETVSGKTRSMREACNNCRVSLVVCYCGKPTIVATNARGTVAVKIVRK